MMTAVSPEVDSVKEMIDNRKHKMVESSIIYLSSAEGAPAVDVTGRGHWTGTFRPPLVLAKLLPFVLISFPVFENTKDYLQSDKHMPAVFITAGISQVPFTISALCPFYDCLFINQASGFPSPYLKSNFTLPVDF